LLLHIDVSVLASFFLEPTAIFASIFLTYFNHTRKRRSSTTLLLFWPTFALAVGVWIRTRVIIGLDSYFSILVAKAVVCILGLLSSFLECIGPEYGSEPQLGEKITQESPVLTANIFSIWVSIASADYKSSLIGTVVGVQLDDSIDEEGR
jgi:energy-converting hydrogenase Eha subunit A